MIQLNQTIPLEVVANPDEIPLGEGIAYFIELGGIDDDIIWVIAMNETGECWSVRNRYIRFVDNKTYGRHRKTTDKQTYISLNRMPPENIDVILKNLAGTDQL